MSEKRLNIIKDEHLNHDTSLKKPSPPSRKNRQKEMQAKFERLWLTNPEQFNPLRNCMQRERLDRTWSLLRQHIDPKDKHTTDIGCGAGVFSRRLRDAGATVVAVDIAENALKHLKEHAMDHIEAKQEAMPATSLPDDAFDLVICTEIIAELHPYDYRLFFAELSRLVKSDGLIICSSPIDIDSIDGVQKLVEIASTELIIVDSITSYHAWYLRLKKYLESPSRFINSWHYPDRREQELAKRHRLSRLWFLINSSTFLIWFWLALSMITNPLVSLLKNNRSLLLTLEKMCRTLANQNGISHFIFVGKRRPLQIIEPENEQPVERPVRKQIWT